MNATNGNTLTPGEAAKVLHVPVGTLSVWRDLDIGPPCEKVKTRVYRYDRNELIRFLTPTTRQHLTTDEAAAALRVKPNTLAHWRCVGKGPESFKVGKFVWYERSVIEAWIQDHQG